MTGKLLYAPVEWTTVLTSCYVIIMFLMVERRYWYRRERERFVICQLDPSRGIRRSSIRRQHVALSVGRFYLFDGLSIYYMYIGNT